MEHYTLNKKISFQIEGSKGGIADLNDFDFSKQAKAVLMELTLKGQKFRTGTYSRALVDNNSLKWIKLPNNTMPRVVKV